MDLYYACSYRTGCGNMQQQYQCPNCGVLVAFGVRFCGNCGTQLNWPTQQVQPSLQFQQQIQQPVQMNWFKRHLNWTYFISWLFCAGLVEGGRLVAETDRLMGLIEVWVGVILLLVVSIWVVKQKGRSLAWMLFIFLGILPIIVLCLSNKNTTE
jgi:hypothetical protein